MLSFGLQAPAWPSSPVAFKLVNVLLHSLNGVLVYLVVTKLLRLSAVSRDQQTLLPLLVAGLWLMHPIHVSTVLYTIQRMTELSAFFSLAGLNLYLLGRSKLLENPRKAYMWMSSGVIGGAGLGVLSKESALLLPLLILVLEATLLCDVHKPRGWRLWSLLLLWLPLAGAVVYLATKLNTLVLNPYDYREFTLKERLLTEGRIVFDYAGKILLPRVGEFGLFHDDFTLSRGWLSPLTTLPAVAGVLLLNAGAIFYRKKAPIASFAVLWFTAGHLLESTIFPLELYFEHRNYLPSFGLLLAISLYVISALNKSRGRLKAGLTGLVLFAAMGMVLITLLEARLWGNPALQATVWAEEKPDSLRAQSRLGEFYIAIRQHQHAADLYEQVASRFPLDAGLHAFRLALRCRGGETVSIPSSDILVQRLETARYSTAPLVAFDDIITKLEAGHCQMLPTEAVLVSLDALAKNRAFAPQRTNLHLLRGRLFATLGRYAEAVAEFEHASIDHPAVALAQVQWSYRAGNIPAAKKHFHRAERLIRDSPLRFGSYNSQLQKTGTLLHEHN